MFSKALLFKPFIIFLFVAGIILVSRINAFSQFLEDYGNVGTLKTFKGQVRDAADGFVSGATIQFSNSNSGDKRFVEADENGIFKVKKLPPSEYKVRVEISGLNITEFTIKIDPRSKSRDASKNYVIIRLAPGCASGGSQRQPFIVFFPRSVCFSNARQRAAPFVAGTGAQIDRGQTPAAAFR